MHRRIATQAQIAATTVVALYILITDRLSERVGDRHNDRGLVPEVVLIAGLVALAIVVVGGIGIVVNKYMAKIQ